jgi:hypothetical protein
MRRAVLLTGLAVLTAACGGGTDDSASDQSPAAPAEATASPEASEDQASALEGTWRTGTVTEADIETTLRDAGLEKWIQRLRALPPSDPPAESNVFILEIHEGKWDLYWEADGKAAEPVDYDAQYEVDGDTVVVSHESDFNEYRWAVDGDKLTLTWLDTTYEGYKGIPEEVFQTALYESDAFAKQE